MSENADNTRKGKKKDHIEVFVEDSVNRKKHQKKRKIMTISLIAVLLICIGIGCALLINSNVFSANSQVTVSFDSTGGSTVESQTIPTGGQLTEVGSPTQNGYVFAGWYYDEAPINAYNKDDVFQEDTTLYAAWYEPEMELDIEEYIKDSDGDITFVVHSDVELTNDNLSDYISCYCADIDQECALSVKAQDDGYLLYSQEEFMPGFTYSVEIIDTNTVYFIKAGDDAANAEAKAYNFTVYKENVNNVVMKADPKLLSTDDVSNFEVWGEVADGETGNENDNGKTIYRATLVQDDGDYLIGDIISLGSGEEDAEENQYYKVIGAVNNDSDCYLDLITPNLDDVYSELEVYYSGDAVYFEDVEEDEETKEFEQELQTSLKESEGYDYLCSAIAMGIKQSPTLQNTVATLDMNSRKRFEQLSKDDIKSLFKNVEVSLSIQKTYDSMHDENGIRGIISFTTGDIDIKLDDNIKLTIKLSITNDLTQIAGGYISPQKDLSLNINEWVTLTNHCNISFDAVIATTSGEEKINITEEIQNLIDSQSDNKSQDIVNSLNQENFFGDDLDYVEIFDKELGNKTVSIYHVLTIQFKLNFHVDIGMRVGLNLNFDSTEVRKVGFCNIPELTGKSGIVTCSQRLSSHSHFTALLKGQVGVRAGFKAEVNISLVHLNKVANIGFSADLGVYEEITGFARFDYDSDSGMLMSGGLKSETGVYVEIDFEWDLFGIPGSKSIAEMKFPFLTIGALEFASEFNETQSAVTFNTKSYNLKSSSNTELLKLKYINIDTSGGGATINIKPASLSGDYAFFLAQDTTGKGSKDDLKYVTVNNENGMVTIAENAPERLDFTVVVQYTKGCSLFSKDEELITKNINLTYMKYKVDDSTKKYMATFYAPDGSVLEQKEYYVGQLPVPPSEDTYEELFIFSAYKLESWAKPWQEDIAAIYEDTDYHLDYELNYVDINFYGTIYNDTAEKYEYGLIATVPTLCGEMPVSPSADDLAVEPGWKFYKWSPELKTAQAGYNYNAEYKQDSNYSWTCFYVGNTRISSDYVEKGTVPEAPDMTQYNDEDREFAGWWPSLHASTNSYEGYTALFRDYVTVTFEDLDGNKISEQRILRGTTPETPEVEDIIEGEEDYYEYRFNHWADEDGVKLGSVYSDTVYSPVYDKEYLEVTTIFDAGEHTFADGTTIKEYKGVYARSQYATPNILNLPEVTYQDNENTYTVDYWQSTEKLNGSYVKLYTSKSGAYTYYKYNLTFTPVFKSEPIEYTVWFYGGDEEICLTGHYGDLITSDMLTGLKKSSTNSNYYYELSDYGLTLPYKFGTVLGTDGLPAQYISVVARFTPVGVDKTVTFNANGGKFTDNEMIKTITAPYGTRASFNEVPDKADDGEYTYEFIGWSENKDATSGFSFSNTMINGDRTLYAVYTKTPVYATLTFSSGSGRFADGSTIKTLQVLIGSAAPAFDEIPLKDSTQVWEYTFSGWSPSYKPGAVVNSDAGYRAQYSAQKKTYTVTFDAGSGEFAGGAKTIEQTYEYGDAIVPPSDPTGASGTGYKYVFSAWSPSLTTDMTVTWSRTFTATYLMVGTGGVGETGIIVSKDGVSEDINTNGTNGVGSIAGYTCEWGDYDGTAIPTLTVTGDGLTFSGSSDKVCAVIESTATNVTFDDLTFSGAYSTGVLTTADTSTRLTVNISGTCVIGNTVTGMNTVRFERPVSLEGTGTGAKLSISGNGGYALYCADDFDVDLLELVIGSTGIAIGNDDGEGEEWCFTNSTIRLDAGGVACGTAQSITFDNTSLTVIGESGVYCADMVVSGASVIDVTASGEDATAIETDCDLAFVDFTGTFSARSTHAVSPGIAVMARGNIKFIESGAEVNASGYNLGGAEISSFNGGTYSSFGILSGGVLVPAAEVTVTP